MHERTIYKYSPGPSGTRWGENLDLGVMAIDYSEVNAGNLSQYATSEELAIAIGVKPKHSNLKQSLWMFKEARIGDIVIVSNGPNIILGFGIISGPYEYFENEPNYKHRRKITWIANRQFDYKKGEIDSYKTLFRGDYFTTTKVGKEVVSLYLQTYPEYKADFKKYGMESNIVATSEPTMEQAVKHSLNQILYGPPGTGKTYQTTEIAYEIVTQTKAKNYKQARDFFQQELQKDENSRRIEFITFHQNYSYEDFMLGIRPDINNAASLTFNRNEGVFYRVCQRARENWLKSQEEVEYMPSFEEVFDAYFRKLYEEGIDLVIPLKSPNSKFQLSEKDDNSLLITNSVGKASHNIVISTLKALYEGTRTIKGGMVSYYDSLLRELRNKAAVMSKGVSKVPRENFVLIIDEINRANISRVFGELITLIEDDKRMGSDNHIKLQLPNGEYFDVPNNLYILGTMNTADKSISLIDIALRRRFEFIGYFPKYDRLEENSAKLLQAINNEIYKRKKTADFLVGHAYFMKNDSISNILLKKVIPLLMEYFTGRVDDVKSIFAGTDYYVEYSDLSYSWIVTSKNSANG